MIQMNLTLAQIRNRAATLLQDENHVRWKTDELDRYVFDAQYEFVRLTGHPVVTSSVTLGPDQSLYDRPSDPPLMELTKARVSNTSIEVPIVTPSLLDEATVFLGEAVGTDWRTQRGPIRAIVLDHASSAQFRVYPVPQLSDNIFHLNLTQGIPVLLASGGATHVLAGAGGVITGILQSAEVLFEGPISPPRNSLRFAAAEEVSLWDSMRGVLDSFANYDVSVTATTDRYAIDFLDRDEPNEIVYDFTQYNSDPSAELSEQTPLISPTFQEALIYGCVERAYLKENELRNIEKSTLFRQRFLEFVADANRREPQNTLTRNTGANKKRIRTAWRWR